ncbi:hypothetical protein HYV44_00595 [Candidatus Microgenomates bacterium]|nr:hypothetical protein [Candidatus Microgenomates bacterium]
MQSIEILALALAVLILVKLGFVLFSPKAWWGLTKTLTDNSRISSATILILAIVVGYYVFSMLSIVEVMAAGAFISLLMATAFFANPKIILDMRKDVMEKGIKIYWLHIAIWLALSIWTLYVLFY